MKLFLLQSLTEPHIRINELINNIDRLLIMVVEVSYSRQARLRVLNVLSTSQCSNVYSDLASEANSSSSTTTTTTVVVSSSQLERMFCTTGRIGLDVCQVCLRDQFLWKSVSQTAANLPAKY